MVVAPTPAPAPAPVRSVTDQLATDLQDVLALGQGLDDEDYKAELSILQNDQSSNLYSALTFEELDLPKPLLDGIYGMKFSKPSKIQSVALPLILSTPPENLIGQAQSGSGKTATFALAMLFRVDETLHQPQALCLAPTRELARQIAAVVRAMGKFTQAKTFMAVPGVDVERGTTITEQIIVGTPGRVESLIKRKSLLTNNIKIYVLDEADVMVGEGGLRDRSMAIKKLILNKACQFLLFSATYADEVRDFATHVVPNHNIITVKKEKLSLDGIKQFWVDCGSEQGKYEVLSNIFSLLDVGKCVIFVQTRATGKNLTAAMREKGHSVGILHGADMDRDTRDTVIDEFRLGTTKVLITTNVLARGIDVLGVSLVINFDIPLTRDHLPDPETYLHRIGRTGRFGRKGSAINFVYDDKSKRDLATIEEYYSKEIVQAPAGDLEALEKLLTWSA